MLRARREVPERRAVRTCAQGRRAAVSIALNIAEGSGRGTDRDFKVFVNRAVTSLLETDAVFKLAVELQYLSRHDHDSVSPLLEKEYFKLVALEKALARRTGKRRRYTDEP